MIYRLKELKGDTIAVPQLVFSKLGIAEEYNVRVALYVLATGITDPDKICADLKLRSRISAESSLSFWAGAGLLERYEENAAPGEEPSAPAPMTWAEIAAASRTDPMISSLIDCAQTGFARPLTHREMEKLVNLYMQEGFAPETVMLCTAYVASTGRSTMAAGISRPLPSTGAIMARPLPSSFPGTRSQITALHTLPSASFTNSFTVVW